MDGKISILDKSKLYKFLFQSTIKRRCLKKINGESVFCLGYWQKAYMFILENLHETVCIQIYCDGIIRLHLKHEHYEMPKSIYLEDAKICDDEFTIKMLRELRSYF